MKKFFLLSTVLLLAFLIQAQNYDAIKTLVTLQQYKKAREDVDKQWTNAKFISKPEAYILKTAVYAGLAADPALKATPAGDQLAMEADAAFTKYREMDPSMALVTDPVYQNGPINVYSSLFTSGYKDYETKNWQSGFQKFKKVVDYADLLISKKVISIAADTNSLLLAGITADNAGFKEESIKYYSRLADLRVNAKDYEVIYNTLVRYYAAKKDMANFEKYKALGHELYPTSEFFTYDKVDFAVGLESDFTKKLQSLEETLASDPNNEKALSFLGEMIYDTLHSQKEGAVPPANAAELEPKMLKAFNKTIELKPNDEFTLLLLAQHYILKRDKIDEARQKHVAEMKARTKPGTQASKDDIAKRDALDAQYAAAYLAAEEPFRKAAEILAKKPQPLSGQDIQRYKNTAGYLGEIAGYRKIKAKGNAADVAKYTAEEKKWNDLYDEISKMKAKPKE